jgi:hypothetical protein
VNYQAYREGETAKPHRYRQNTSKLTFRDWFAAGVNSLSDTHPLVRFRTSQSYEIGSGPALLNSRVCTGEAPLSLRSHTYVTFPGAVAVRCAAKWTRVGLHFPVIVGGLSMVTSTPKVDDSRKGSRKMPIHSQDSGIDAASA